MKIQNRGARFALTCLVLIWGVAMGSPAWPAPPSNKPGGGPPGQAGGGQAPAGDTAAPSGSSVGGEAFGVFVKGDVDSVKVRVPKTPHVVLPPDGGMASDEVLDISIPATLDSHTLPVITTGAIGGSKASAQSSATVENLNILSGLITAQLVVSISSSSADGSAASSNAEGSTLLGLSVNGVPMGDVTPAPNTTIDIPGVGTVILNEQISGGDGVHSTALTVQMIHVVLNGTTTADVIVASAHSDVNFTPTSTPATGFMTGGGRLGTGRDIATFGFHAGPGLKGQLQYIDHSQGLDVHSTGITSYDSSPEGTTCRAVSGKARVNGTDGFDFTVNFACDNGEPGVGHDTFEISVTGPKVNYSSTRDLNPNHTLTGGNLQLH